MIRVTVDTNVIISALKFGGDPRRTLDRADSGVIKIAVSPPILDEIADVLQRDKIGWSASEARDFVKEFSQVADVVHPHEGLDVIKDDPDDNRILECAAAARSDYIISGDKHLLRLKSFAGRPIVKVSDFLDIIEGSRAMIALRPAE